MGAVVDVGVGGFHVEVVVTRGRGVSVEPVGVFVDKGCVEILAGGVEEVVEVFLLSCKGAEGF